MIRQDELIDKIKAYDPDVDEDLVNRAYVFAMKAHGAQTRASGDPYFTHPLEVASVLTHYKLDVSTIVTALLHDTVEDTDATLEEIEALFGAEIAKLVDGVTKLSQLEGNTIHSKQAENFRKLVVAMSEDLRVLLVKLADRLHNMQTIHYIKKPEKRKRIARETLEIYAALAERIGMRRIKEELQDLAFTQLFPEARESIVNRLKFLREKGRATIEKSRLQIESKLKDGGLNTYKVFGREKKPYSIWKKMERKNIGFEQLGDIIAYRIIVDTEADCYHALGVIHSAYHTVPGYFKDYISTPKRNGYQSLHTSVIGPQQQRIEVQIRTQHMHDIAEYGLAAHWAYKGDGQGQITKDGKQFRWIRELLEIVEQSANPEDFLENTKLEMYHDQVFCFTPKGDIESLPLGATPVDFAYAVHSGVGNTCVGAKINGRIVPLKTRLRNGDQIEIITNKSQTPSPAWERFVVTGKARSEIRKFVRSRQREEYVSLGRSLLSKLYKQESGKELNDKLVEPLLKQMDRKEVEDLYAEVGEGTLSRGQVIDLLLPEQANKKKKSEFNLFERITNRKKENKKESMPIRGLIPGMAIHYAGCCHPIPGDTIVGIVTTGRGVTIHTTDCDTLDNFTDTPERWIDVSWDSGADSQHVGRIRANVSHSKGGLASIANSIAKDEGNITNFKIINRNIDFFEVLIDLEVNDTEHLNHIIANMRHLKTVQTVERCQE
ncbi:MAG: bifunctional (p)ppGpp synthetase/guanosine-3',5'-bis(diphosphate) 3'-pyrophosphohydrolase [Rickettsiales bacterium]|nr:bifunctional (p)ppGpp synthetase/guanosine-3',5'-bis(diphosphate) 3'-pyrophosphohydrolase [Rickettsiales bacterium]